MSDNFLKEHGYDHESAYIKEKEDAARAKRDAERKTLAAKQEKASHWMICPKCGGQMIEKEMEKVKVDICTSCDGIFFDKGEFQIVSKRAESHALFDQIASFLKF